MSPHNDPFEFENRYFLSCKPQRFGKALVHYELFKRTHDVAGEIVECGVFKGASFSRLALLRSLFGPASQKRIIGFDIFGQFPQSGEEDREKLQEFVQSAGDRSISVEALRENLQSRGLVEGVELIAGDICETVPRYVAENPNLRISLLNVDADLYAPTKVILEHLCPLVVQGGIVMLDNYGVFPGETRAVDEYFDGAVEIKKHPFSKTPCYYVKTSNV